jgi:hypothetical protein
MRKKGSDIEGYRLVEDMKKLGLNFDLCKDKKADESSIYEFIIYNYKSI